MIIKLILGLALLVSLITDIKYRRILNIITLPAILFGIVYYTTTQGWNGFLFSGKGFLVGMGILLIPYLLGGMGAGDVKLMAAIGALTGTTFTMYAFFYIGLIGGIIALIMILKTKGLANSFKSFWYCIKSFFYSFLLFRSNLGAMVINDDKQNNSRIVFPYGVAIVLGTLCAFVLGW